ncbi:hypothetical protein [Glycomyces arizonensis]|uniref:hypothetical protein n=1 Tax=Glycomyces arizonensis TaxID=256035 RepID=UPI000407F247|nr:hypothetical protein [Glycomyces arizonensis]
MAQQVETVSIKTAEEDLPGEQPSPEIPTSPASLWASESKAHYSITHTGECDTHAWIDCDCVIHID